MALIEEVSALAQDPAKTGDTPNEASREIPVLLQHPAQSASEEEEEGWPLSSVLAFLMAVGIAHFIIVTGGWTNKLFDFLNRHGFKLEWVS